MKNSKFLFLALLGVLAFSACGDDEENATDLLTKSAWTLSDSRADDDGDGTLESVIEACDKDDTTDFNDDGTYTSDEGATKCDATDPQTTNGAWVLSSDGKTLTITEDGFAVEFEVVELTNSRMELRSEIVFGADTFISEAIFTR